MFINQKVKFESKWGTEAKSQIFPFLGVKALKWLYNFDWNAFRGPKMEPSFLKITLTLFSFAAFVVY